MNRLCKMLLISILSGAAPFQSFANSGAWIDNAKIAKEQRIVNTVTDGYKGLYDLTFNDLEAQIDKNIRYFATPAAYREYVDGLKASGFSEEIHKNLFVVQNRVIGKPQLSGGGGAYHVSFDAEQKLITYNAVTTKCVHIDATLADNQRADLRSSEFSFTGSPRMTDSSACE